MDNKSFHRIYYVHVHSMPLRRSNFFLQFCMFGEKELKSEWISGTVSELAKYFSFDELFSSHCEKIPR